MARVPAAPLHVHPHLLQHPGVSARRLAQYIPPSCQIVLYAMVRSSELREHMSSVNPTPQLGLQLGNRGSRVIAQRSVVRERGGGLRFLGRN